MIDSRRSKYHDDVACDASLSPIMKDHFSGCHDGIGHWVCDYVFPPIPQI